MDSGFFGALPNINDFLDYQKLLDHYNHIKDNTYLIYKFSLYKGYNDLNQMTMEFKKMADLDLTNITVDELIKSSSKTLLALQNNLHKAIEIRKETERRDIYDKIQTLASESGFTLAELVTDEKNLKKATIKIKYRNPNNKEECWTGRGRKPTWLVVLLEAGKKLEDFEI